MLKSVTKLILALASALMCNWCFAESIDSNVARQIDELFAVSSNQIKPGYAVGIVKNGELVFSKGYGYSDLKNKRQIDAKTAFNLASLSKQFTAAAIASLIVEGELSLEDRLVDHWAEIPEFMQGIKVSHLIYMTSGLPEYYRLRSPKGSWDSESGFTNKDAILAVFDHGKLDFKPGTQWAYSNTNYQLLAELVAIKSGKTFRKYCEDKIFQPLAMKSSWIDAPIENQRETRSVAYVASNGAESWKVAPRISPHFGGSGMFSSLHDLALWDKALYIDKTFGRDFSQLMLSTREFSHSKTNDAFGLVHGKYRDQATIWYEGVDYGVSTYMVRLPERNETYICLANFHPGLCGDKVRALLDIVLSRQAK